LHTYKREHPAPFKPNGTVDLHALRAWMAKTGKRGSESPTLERARLAVLTETARILKMQNDVKSGALIERAFIISAFAKLAAELNAIRLQSEEQAPIRLAAAGGDIPRTREVFRTVLDEFMLAIRGLAKFWEETQHAPSRL
jgi:hypothetical protein